jgi:hypothetical protein
MIILDLVINGILAIILVFVGIYNFHRLRRNPKTKFKNIHEYNSYIKSLPPEEKYGWLAIFIVIIYCYFIFKLDTLLSFKNIVAVIGTIMIFQITKLVIKLIAKRK